MSVLLPRWRSAKASAGFTLIELLTTVAIVVILAGLLFTSGKTILSNSKKAGAMAQMRQIGISILQYANENNGAIPGPTTVAVYAWGKAPLYAGDAAHLGNWIAPYYEIPQDGKVHVIRGLQSPILAPSVKENQQVPSYAIPLDPKIQAIMGFPQGSIGSAQAAIASGAGPKRLVALTKEDRNVGVLTTADQGTWNGGAKQLLPETTADKQGRRLWLFLDGTVEYSTGRRNE